jgi:hypothetical protein
MTITAFSGCRTDRSEYGRYARSTGRGDLTKITVTATGIDGDPGDIVVYSLVNQASGRVIARAEQSYDSALSDENSVTFAIEDCVDEWGIFRAVRGVYVARVAHLTTPAYLEPTVYADSAPFRIRVVTAAELRDRWLFGVRLGDYNRLVADDTGIPGVAITGATGIQEGGYPLRWHVADRSLAFGSEVGGIPAYGPPQAGIPASGTHDFVLWNDALDGYVFVRVDAAALPATDVEGGIGGGVALLRPAELTDDDLGRHLDIAAERWQAIVSLAVPIEPWTVGTTLAQAAIRAVEANDPARAKLPFDRAGVSPEPWRDSKARQGPTIQLPGRRVKRLHFLAGYYNTGRVLDFDIADWWTLDEYNGNAHFVPNLSARLPAGPILIPLGVGGAMYGGTLFARDYVPNFWHFAFTHGLDDLRHGAGALLREAIAREALVPIYLLAGRAAQSVYASESFNRDGVGLQRAYSAGQMGVYSGEILAHDAWVKANQSGIAKQIHGIIVQV